MTSELIQTGLVLLLVCLLAYFGLRFGLPRVLPMQHGPLRIVARLPLEPKRSLLLVDVGGRGFLLGSAESGMTLLAEVPLPESKASSAPPRASR